MNVIQDAIFIVFQFIKQDLMVGFGVYSVVLFISKHLRKPSPSILEFDLSACKLVINLILFSGIIWLLSVVVNYLLITDEVVKHTIWIRMTGQYWYAFWLQMITWVLASQGLRSKYLQQSILYRIFLSSLFVFTFEIIAVLISQIHNDFLPQSFSLGWGLGFTLTNLILKLIEFVLIVGIFHHVKKYLCNMRFSKRQ
jgi:hypothetical protein